MRNAGETSGTSGTDDRTRYSVRATAALLFLCCGLGPFGCGGPASASRMTKPAPTADATPAPAVPVEPAGPSPQDAQPARESLATPAPSGPSTPSASSAPATAPAATVAFEDRKAGFRLAYPAGWRPKKSDDYTLMLVPATSAGATSAGAASAAGDPAGDATRAVKSDDGALAGSKITVDVPWLPPHLPGMITIGRVEDGYLDDQKARFADVKVTEKSDPVLPGAKARRLVLTGRAKAPGGSPGPAYSVVTLLEIHADRVYLVSAEARAEDFPAVLADFEKVCASMQWTK